MPKWSYENDIAYDKIDISKVQGNDFLFNLLAIASFIEITSDTYAVNLSDYYKDCDEAVTWLNDVWELEEVQHGKALRMYVNQVWPDFNWQKSYDIFLKSYLPLCGVESFQPTQAKEMLARMIVEMGTSTFYRALEEYSKDLKEPILGRLAYFINKDEVNHYGYFDHYFKYYNKHEKNGRSDIVKVIIHRLKEANDEDVKLGFYAVHENVDSNQSQEEAFESFHQSISEYAKKYYPYNMAIKMMLHPLDLNSMVASTVTPVLKQAMRILGV